MAEGRDGGWGEGETSDLPQTSSDLGLHSYYWLLTTLAVIQVFT